MATNAMIVIRKDFHEKQIFCKYNSGVKAFVLSLVELPWSMLNDLYEQMRNESGYLPFYHPRSWCEYGYVIDLDKEIVEIYKVTYDRPLRRRKPDHYNAKRLKLVEVRKIKKNMYKSSANSALEIMWEGVAHTLYFHTRKKNMEKLINALRRVGRWTTRSLCWQIPNQYNGTENRKDGVTYYQLVTEEMYD